MRFKLALFCHESCLQLRLLTSMIAERAVIICSRNVLSDAEVKSAIASSQVYASLGCKTQCGRCARAIKVMHEESSRFVTPEPAF